MGTNTTNFALPEGRCSDVDRIEQAGQRLRELVEEGLNSGPGRMLMPERAVRLNKQACRADTPQGEARLRMARRVLR